MQLTNLVGAAAIMAAVATAAPACKNPSTVINFDNLPVGAAPPQNYGGISYSGLTVTDATGGDGLKPSSGNNSVSAGGFESDAVISTGTKKSNTNIAFELKSFAFGCTAPYPDTTDNEQVPVPCSIQVFSTLDFGGGQISSYGPFSSTVNYTALENGIPAKFQTVKLGSVASEFKFVISGAQAYTQLYLDSFSVVQENDCPS